nr:MAG TPA: hypothetical protein [Caudoviricetes sp.]
MQQKKINQSEKHSHANTASKNKNAQNFSHNVIGSLSKSRGVSRYERKTA